MRSLTKIQLMSLLQQSNNTEIPINIIEYWYAMYGHNDTQENEEVYG